jgi:hypothetical protein
MQFVFPLFLIALAAIAIPIIIHLFYFRRFKKVYFTNVRFLREVKEETSARSRLRNLLVLLMRILAIIFLVLAFAQPFIPKDVEVKQGEKSVSIFIDNSFSMSALSQEVPLLELAKRRAREIVNAYPVEDRFQILTHDFEGRHQRLLGKEDALSLIDEIEISPAVRQLSTVLNRQGQLLEQADTENKVAYLISDFQRNITDLEGEIDTTIELNLVPLQSVQQKNVAVDSAWFETPVQMINQTNRLIVKVRNYTNDDVDNIRLSLKHEGQEKPVGTLEIPAGSSVLDTVNVSVLRTGWHEAELKITDYPVEFDDRYLFAFEVAEKIDVLVINEGTGNAFLSAAFNGMGNFELTNEQSRSLNYAEFPQYELIVLNDLRSVSSGLSFELKEYVQNGGNLLVFPGPSADLTNFNSFLKNLNTNQLQPFSQEVRTVGQINTEEFIFKDVFENISANLKLPVTQGNYQTTRLGSRGEEPLLTYRDGTTYLGKYTIGQGYAYLCAAPLSSEYNNLIQSGEIFIPMLFKMAVSSGKEQRIAYVIGKDEVIEAPNSLSGAETVYKLKGPGEEFIPEQRLIGARVVMGVHSQIDRAGFYSLSLAEEDVLYKYAFNYNRTESDLSYLNVADLGEMVGDRAAIIDIDARADFGALIGERSKGIVLWRWCVILALLFLGIETLLLRLWKTG